MVRVINIVRFLIISRCSVTGKKCSIGLLECYSGQMEEKVAFDDVNMDLRS
jgi:hypothetical protein